MIWVSIDTSDKTSFVGAEDAVKQRRRTPQQSWRGMQGAAAHQHRFPVFNTRSQAVLDFMNSMIYNRRIFSFIGYCFQQPCICFMFIPAAELRGIHINKIFIK